MGECEPARLGPEGMEYTTLQQVLQKLRGRFKPA
jgi:fructose 1,6-bisphosphatase